MKQLRLIGIHGTGKFALVSDQDYDALSTDSWSLTKDGYVFNSKYGYRLANHLLQPGPGYIVDHRNHNPLDNSRENLRICTPMQNAWNALRKKLPRSGYVGVYEMQSGFFKAVITHDGRRYDLGIFNTARVAGRAYNDAAKKFRGEYACVNEVA